MSTFLLFGQGFDPYENLAVEEALLELVQPDDCILYLWQNARTVVLGRNQNPWKECRLPLLEAEGVRLARRPSGGGAVYHDAGNLNFSFVAGGAVWDTARQCAVIADALERLGLRCTADGRNDLLLDGRKFSGHACYRRKHAACHHGTLMVDVDLAAVERCLTPPKAKLEGKGVASVRARVVNLRECSPELTVEALQEALVSAFADAFSAPTVLTSDAPDPALVRQLTAHNRSDEWRFGTEFPAELQCERHFVWGQLELRMRLQGRRISACRVYTDAMDDTLAAGIEQALTGCPLRREALEAALQKLPEREDVLALLQQLI